jgi:hypothetical protein
MGELKYGKKGRREVGYLFSGSRKEVSGGRYLDMENRSPNSRDAINRVSTIRASIFFLLC